MNGLLKSILTKMILNIGEIASGRALLLLR